MLRSAGRLLLLEHVRSTVAPVRWLGPWPISVEFCKTSKWGIIEEVVARNEA